MQRLKPRHLPTFEAVATGVGGSVTFLYTVEVPIALQGVCGLLTVNVVKNSLPFLLPMPFCKKLGMILNTTDNTATWTKIGKVSEIVELPSEHIAVDILEFPPGGWKIHISAITPSTTGSRIAVSCVVLLKFRTHLQALSSS